MSTLLFRILLTFGLGVATAFAGDLQATQAWSRATPPGTTVGVGYLTLRNAGTQPRTLRSASSPAAAAVEFHETRRASQGLTSMQPLPGVVVPPGGALTFQPNGRHLMLVGLKAPLVAGQRIPVTLQFDDRAVTVELSVQPLTALGPPDRHPH